MSREKVEVENADKKAAKRRSKYEKKVSRVEWKVRQVAEEDYVVWTTRWQIWLDGKGWWEVSR